MLVKWTGGLIGLLVALLLYGLAWLPLGWAVAALVGWLLGQYVLQVRHQADHDDLTGISNRRPFERLLAGSCRRLPVSLLFIELDDFGLINKRFSHMVGDQAILHVSRLLAQKTRRSDLLARWGGDEFVLLLPGTDTQSAMVLAERIRTTIAETPFHTAEGVVIPLSASTGVASLTEPDGSPAELLRRAEEAHHVAKRRKNAVHLYP